MFSCLAASNNRPNTACFFADENWYGFNLDPTVNSAKVPFNTDVFDRNGISKAVILSKLKNIDLGDNLGATIFSDTNCTLDPRKLITGNNDVASDTIQCILLERIGDKTSSVTTALNELESAILSLAYLFAAVILIFIAVIIILTIILLIVKYSKKSPPEVKISAEQLSSYPYRPSSIETSSFGTLQERFKPTTIKSY